MHASMLSFQLPKSVSHASARLHSYMFQTKLNTHYTIFGAIPIGGTIEQHCSSPHMSCNRQIEALQECVRKHPRDREVHYQVICIIALKNT